MTIAGNFHAGSLVAYEKKRTDRLTDTLLKSAYALKISQAKADFIFLFFFVH